MLQQISLNSYWKFAIDDQDKGREQQWFEDMPENVSDIWVPSCWNECSEEWFHYEGIAWYFRKFLYRKDPEVKRNILFFNGVNYSCEVWLNGCFVGAHTGGFTPFEMDVSQLIREDGENYIAVRVDSTMTDMTVPPMGVDWFNYGGIFREVYLRGTGASWLEDVFVVTSMNGDVSIKLEAGGEPWNGTAKADCAETDGLKVNCPGSVMKLHITVEDPDAVKPVVDRWLDFGSKEFTADLHLENAKLWSPETPFLYAFTLELAKDGKITDRWEHKIGVREFSIRDRKILLNGKPVQLMGYSKHEEYPMHARTFSYDIVRKDYELCKRSNANFIRMCHYPHHLKEYEIASEMGFVVMAEVPNVNFTKKQFEDRELLQNSINQTREMIRYYKNETCIMFWSLFIECRTSEDSAVESVPEYTKLVKQMDPTRFTIHASVIPLEDRTYEYFDIVGINYWSGWYYAESIEDGSKNLDMIASRYPDKPVVLTSGGWEGIYGYHSYQKREKWSEEEQSEYLENLIKMYMTKEYIVGAIIWTFNDFRVSPWVLSNNARWILRPMELNHKGVMDYFRRPKLSYYTMQKMYGEWGRCDGTGSLSGLQGK